MFSCAVPSPHHARASFARNANSLRRPLAAISAALAPLLASAQVTLPDWANGSPPVLNVSAGSTLNITTTASKTYNATNLTNSGTIHWLAGPVSSTGGAILNQTGATFNDSASNTLGGAATFTNQGTYKKLSGASTISQVFDNQGAVQVAGGTLTLSGGGNASAAATYSVDSGATLVFNSGTHTLAGGATFSGAGATSLSGATLNVASGTVSFANLTFSSGTLGGTGGASISRLTQTGGSVTASSLALTANSTWSGGNWNTTAASTASIAAGTTFTVSGSGVKDFNRRTVTNSGTFEWTGGELRTGNGGGIVNASGASFNDSASSSINGAYGSGGSFSNAGTYNKTAAGATNVALPFTNTGTVNVNTGTLSFDQGGSTAAGSTINVANGATLNFGGGIFAVASAGHLTFGATSNTTMSGGTVNVATGGFSPPKHTHSNGTLNLSDTTATSSIPNLTLTAGDIVSAGTLSTAALTHSGGTLNPAALTLTGNSTWTGGNWNSAAASTASIAAGTTFTASGVNVKDFKSRTITNSGTFEWTGGELRTGNGGGFVNAVGATFNDSANNSFNAAYGGGGSFTNNGTYTKSGAGTSTFSVPFHSNGTLNLPTGTLALDQGGSTGTTAAVNAAAGTTLRFGGGTFTVANSANLDLDGTVAIAGGTFTLNAGSFSAPVLTMSHGALNVVDTAATSTIPSVTLSGGTITTAGPLSVAALSQTGGSIAASSLAITNNSTWTGGDWSSAATSTASIAAGTTLTASGTNVKDFNRRTITNRGTFEWTGGELRTGNNGGFVNASGATFNNSANNSFNAAYGGGGSFTNHGTYNKTGTGTSTISTALHNHGTLNLTAGTLALTAGGTAVAGSTLNVASGATLAINSGNFAFAQPSTLAASGTTSFTGGTATFTTGTFTLPLVSLAGGTLSGDGTISTPSLTHSSGSIETAGLVLTNTATWSAGHWNSAAASTAQINPGATLTLASTNVHDFNRRTITNQGTLDWNAGQLRTGNGGGLVNAAGATINDAANDSLNAAYGSGGTFTNNGTYNKSGTGTSTLATTFENNAVVNVNGGTLSLTGGGTTSASGRFNLADGTTLHVGGGTHTLADGASVTGNATLSVTQGTLAVSSGTVALPNVSVTGGALNGAGALTTPAFTQNQGSVGIKSLSLTGTISWTGGDWNSTTPSTATIATGSTLNLSSTASHDFSQRTIVNRGTTNWSAGYIRSGEGGSFHNLGTFVDTNSNNWTIHRGFGPATADAFTFLNDGTYRRNAADKTSYVDIPFTNNGRVEVLAGELQFRAGGSVASTGTIDVSSGAAVTFTQGFSVANGVSLTGGGHYNLTNGTFDVAGAMQVSTFNMTGGTLAGTNTLHGSFNWSGGTWSAAAARQTTIAAGSTLNLNSGSNKDFDFRSIVNNGTVNWTGGYLRGGNGSVFTNNATFVDSNAGNWTIHRGFGTATADAFTFVNNGTYRRDAANTTYVDVPFNNNGTVDLRQGSLEFRGGGSLAASGTIVAAQDTNVYFRHDYTVSNGASLTGAGTYWLTNGTLDVAGTMSATTFNMTGGILAGINTLNGLINWSGGNWNTATDNQTTTIASTTTLNLNSGSNKDFDRRSIVNEGTVKWNGGYIRAGNGSVFTNNATFIDANAGGWTIHRGYGLAGDNAFKFVNNGTYRRDADNTTYIDIPFENNGTVDLVKGDLQFRGGGTLAATGSINAAALSNVYFTQNYDVSTGASLTGAGTYWLIGGTLTVTGTMNVTKLNQTAGRLEGSNTINGIYNWNGGDWNTATPGHQTIIAAGATLNLPTGNNKDLERRTVENRGTTTWDLGYIRGGNGSAFINAAGATFEDRNANSYTVHRMSEGTFTFTNNGTYNRNVGGTTYFDTTFDNNGTINLSQGDIRLRQGGAMGASSIVNAAADTNFYITNDYTVRDGAQFLGNGSFTHTGGNLSIEGTLKATAFNWWAGSWNATATSNSTTIGSSTVLNLVSGNNKDFSGRAIVNQGTVNWDLGYIRGTGGATFTNAAGATFRDRNASSYTVHNSSPSAGTFTFTNNGTYSREAGGTTYFDAPFNNHGTIALQQGNIELRQGGTMGATSLVQVASGANLYLTNDYTLLTGARFTGDGNIMQTGGTLTLDGTLKASAFNWFAGAWNSSASATATIDSSSIVNLVSGHNKDFRGTIRNEGIVNWRLGYLRAADGAAFVNAAGGVFNDENASSYTVHNPSTGTFAFINHGTYNRDVGGSTAFDTTFNNHGVLNLKQGDIHLRAGGTMGATSVVNTSDGATLTISSDYTLLDGAKFAGPGVVVQTGGTLTLDGFLRAQNFHWYAGTWNSAAPATTTIAPGSTLSLVSGHNKDFNGRTIENQGTVDWQLGYIRGGNGSSFTNTASGVFNDQNAHSYTIYNAFDGAFTFTNAGTYNKTTAGTTNIQIPFTNSGTLNVGGGSLVFSSTFSNTGAIHLANNAHLTFSGTATVNAPLTGTGTIHGSVIAGGIVAPGNSPGTLGITGTLTLLSTSTLLFELAGASPGSGYDQLDVGGLATLAGNLSVSFLNGYQHSTLTTQTFTLLTAGNLSGAFLNVPNGGFLTTSDGAGIFQVNYGPASALGASLANSVVLSNFQAIPEPSTYALLALGCAALLLTRRRR